MLSTIIDIIKDHDTEYIEILSKNIKKAFKIRNTNNEIEMLLRKALFLLFVTNTSDPIEELKVANTNHKPNM